MIVASDARDASFMASFSSASHSTPWVRVDSDNDRVGRKNGGISTALRCSLLMRAMSCYVMPYDDFDHDEGVHDGSDKI